MKFALLLPGCAALFWAPLADALVGQSRLVLMAALGATVCAWPRGVKGLGSVWTLAVVLPWIVAAWRLDVSSAALGTAHDGLGGMAPGTAMFGLSLAWLAGATWWGAAVPERRHGWHWLWFGGLWLLPAAVGWWGHEAQVSLSKLIWFPLPSWCGATPFDGSSAAFGMHTVLHTLVAGLIWHLVARRSA